MSDPRDAEITRLRRCLRDLVGFFTLPALWTDSAPAGVARTLLETLSRAVNLELAYLWLPGAADEPPVEEALAARDPSHGRDARALARELCRVLGEDRFAWPLSARGRLAGKELSIVTLRLGLGGELGVLAAASERPGFPNQAESLLLNVSANQASLGLRAALLRGAQERHGLELDRLVAERTRELTDANAALRHEIFERERLEADLRAAELESRSIVDSLPAFVFLLSPSGALELVNRQTLDYTGMTHEQLQGPGAPALVHDEDRALAVEGFERGIAGGAPFELVYRLRRHDGVYHWFQVRGVPLCGGDGAILRWYVVHTDIDDRKRAEEELRQSEAFLAQGEAVSETGSFLWHVDRGEIRWSKQLYRIFGFEPGSRVTLEAIRNRIHPDDHASFDELTARARAGQDLEYQHRLAMADGSERHVHLVARATPDAGGRSAYIGAVQDVTERRVSEQALNELRSELTHASRAMSLGVLTASIAHELNQPLSGIVTNAGTALRLLGAEPPNVEGALETARRTLRDSKRASEVIARLRALFGKKDFAVQAVDLNDAVREVVALVGHELQGHRVVVLLQLDEALGPVTGDRVQLQQVMLNFLLNARDAMKEVHDRPRELHLETAQEADGSARLTVRDTGVGIPPEALDAPFEAFYTTKSDGMGIGLSVSRWIIERHEGRLWASRNEGPGMAFSFSLPPRLASVAERG